MRTPRYHTKAGIGSQSLFLYTEEKFAKVEGRSLQKEVRGGGRLSVDAGRENMAAALQENWEKAFADPLSFADQSPASATAAPHATVPAIKDEAAALLLDPSPTATCQGMAERGPTEAGNPPASETRPDTGRDPAPLGQCVRKQIRRIRRHPKHPSRRS